MGTEKEEKKLSKKEEKEIKKEEKEIKKAKKEKRKQNKNYEIYQEGSYEQTSIKIFDIILIVFIAVVVTFFVTKKVVENKYLTSTSLDEQIEYKIKEIKDVIDKNYYGEVSDEDLLNSTLEGYVSGLGDKYSVYYTKEEYDELLADISGNYTGIGIVVAKNTKTDEIIIVQVIDGSPSKEAGLLAGDIILKVDGIDVSNSEFEDVTDSISGAIGTSVNLVISRNGEEKSFDIQRQNIIVNPVEAKMLDDNIAYIKYTSFDSTATNEFIEKAKELQAKGATKMILDLRENGGGILSSAQALAGTFLPNSATLMYRKDKDGNTTPEIVTGDAFLANMELVVLVNGNSASASEVVTAALKDYGKATVVGTTTYGKGVVQEIIKLSQGDAVKLTICEYLTPNKNSINKVGITPDIEIEDDETTTEDEQLNKAIEILNNK